MVYLYHPTYKYVALSGLVSGVIMILAASLTTWKISKGSKNVFAYVLMCFTVLLGVANVGIAFSFAFTREVEIPDGNYYVDNFYVSEISL